MHDAIVLLGAFDDVVWRAFVWCIRSVKRNDGFPDNRDSAEQSQHAEKSYALHICAEVYAS